jgi:hypothetical protein
MRKMVFAEVFDYDVLPVVAPLAEVQIPVTSRL